MQQLEKEKHGVETMLANLMNAIEQGIITPTTMNRLKELETRLDEIVKQTIMVKAEMTTTITEEEIISYYSKALKMNGKALINLLVEKIILYNDKVEIYFKTPNKQGPDDGQGLLLYTKIVTAVLFPNEKDGRKMKLQLRIN